MPNTFSYIALFFLFPLVAIGLFRWLPRQSAIIFTFLAGFLFLPEKTAFDVQVLPALNKFTLPGLLALLILWFAREKTNRQGRSGILVHGRSVDIENVASVQSDRQFGVVGVLLALYLVSPLLTVISNRDAVPVGPFYLKGLGWRDGFNVVVGAFFSAVPFLVARRYLGNPSGLQTLLRMVALFGFAYSWLVLFEVRMSPQLHTWIYGFFPHQFVQQIRQEGFRAVVFTEHGLKVAIFLGCAALASASIYRMSAESNRNKWLWLTIWLLFVLVLQKSLGALLIAISLVGLTLVGTHRVRLTLMMLIALVLIAYPVVRTSSYFNSGQILELISGFETERVGSLGYRFYNEDLLLEKANARPILGWGGWGRSRVYNERGRDESITDGLWIIQLGQAGWLGYVALFGLWTIPVLRLWGTRNSAEREIAGPIAVAGMLVLLLIDLVPNSGLPHLNWLMAGALVGWIDRRRAELRAGLAVSSRSPMISTPARSGAMPML